MHLPGRGCTQTCCTAAQALLALPLTPQLAHECLPLVWCGQLPQDVAGNDDVVGLLLRLLARAAGVRGHVSSPAHLCAQAWEWRSMCRTARDCKQEWSHRGMWGDDKAACAGEQHWQASWRLLEVDEARQPRAQGLQHATASPPWLRKPYFKPTSGACGCAKRLAASSLRPS